MHLISLLPQLEGLILPSKFYGILAAGRPVVFIGDPDGELARLLLSNLIHNSCKYNAANTVKISLGARLEAGRVVLRFTDNGTGFNSDSMSLSVSQGTLTFGSTNGLTFSAGYDVTPGGNWSSYPPHKHDEQRPGEEAELEEIYYIEIDGPNGFGYQRVFPSREGGSDVLAEVRSGDAVLVPDGWHGPSIAQPGHDMYYLNVMAGPGGTREWRICFHPDHVESTGGYR